MQSDAVRVTRADREAAADLWNDLGCRRTNPPPRYAEAFARHRIAATAAERERAAGIAERAVTYVVGEQRDLCDRIAAAIRQQPTIEDEAGTRPPSGL